MIMAYRCVGSMEIYTENTSFSKIKATKFQRMNLPLHKAVKCYQMFFIFREILGKIQVWNMDSNGCKRWQEIIFFCETVTIIAFAVLTTLHFKKTVKNRSSSAAIDWVMLSLKYCLFYFQQTILEWNFFVFW